jgi:hypothetical protein
MNNLKAFFLGVLWVLGLPLLGLSQADSTDDRAWRVGGSLTYIWNEGDPALHQEYTLNVNLSYQFHPRWTIGLAGLNIWSQGVTQQWIHHVLVGTFGQFNLVNVPRMRIYPEVGLYRGNYCTCGQADPYKIPFHWYRSIGAGTSIHLTSGLSLELGFYGYKILGELPGKYSYTQYVIGVEWQFQ